MSLTISNNPFDFSYLNSFLSDSSILSWTSQTFIKPGVIPITGLLDSTHFPLQGILNSPNRSILIKIMPSFSPTTARKPTDSPETSMSSSKSAQWHLKPLRMWSYFIYPIFLLLFPSNMNSVESNQPPYKSALVSIPPSVPLFPILPVQVQLCPSFPMNISNHSATSTFHIFFHLMSL